MVRGIEVHNGKVVLGETARASFFVDLGQGKTIASHVYGAKIQIDTSDNWSDPSTVNHDMHALWVLWMGGIAPAFDSSLLRLENNSPATLNSVISVPVGGGGDFAYFLTVNPNDRTAWSSGGNVTTGLGARGWLKVFVAGADRWIQLYAEPAL